MPKSTNMDTEKKEDEKVTVDNILDILKPFGLFNILSFFMILLPVFSSGMYSSVYNFEVMDLDYRCKVPECAEDPSIDNFTIPKDENGNYKKCTRYAPFSNATLNGTYCSQEHFDLSMPIGCDSFVYYENHSIVKEFDLACQDWKRSLVGTVHNAGFFISIPLTGFISDRYGRLYAVVFACVSNGIFGVIRALSSNYNMFVIFEFLEPAFGGGVYTACFVLALELVVPSGRVLVSLLFNTMFILGGVSVTLLSWWLMNWRYLLIIIYTPSVFVVIYLWSLKESFRWLFSKGRYDDALQVLKTAEKINKVTVPKNYYEQVEQEAKDKMNEKECMEAKNHQSTFKQMISSTMIWKRSFICSFMWICSTLVYYGLSINAIELSGNSYTNYIVVLAIEAPANICKLFLLDRYGRKKVMATAYILTGIILINYGFVPHGVWSLIFYLGGKFFITLAYNSLYVFAAEVFPTNYRTSLLAVCSTVGRIGATWAPQTPLLAKVYEYLPTILFGVSTILSGFLVLLLPETNHMKLPDSLQEAQDQEKNRVNLELKGKDDPEQTININKTKL